MENKCVVFPSSSGPCSRNRTFGRLPLIPRTWAPTRALLHAAVFFPQCIDEDDLERLFPTTFDRVNTFDKFYILSRHIGTTDLSRCSHHFETTFARRIRSRRGSLPCIVKEQSAARMLVHINPKDPGFAKTRWITSEDVKVVHLLDVFVAIDAASGGVWETCANFIQ